MNLNQRFSIRKPYEQWPDSISIASDPFGYTIGPIAMLIKALNEKVEESRGLSGVTILESWQVVRVLERSEFIHKKEERND